MTDPGNHAADYQQDARDRLALFIATLVNRRRKEAKAAEAETGVKATAGDRRLWTLDEVAAREDSTGEPYVSRRLLSFLVNANLEPDRQLLNRTLRRLNLALHLYPGTVEAVLRTPDHGFDPRAVEEWTPPPVLSSRTLDAMERETQTVVAGRIAQRAAAR